LSQLAKMARGAFVRFRHSAQGLHAAVFMDKQPAAGNFGMP